MWIASRFETKWSTHFRRVHSIDEHKMKTNYFSMSIVLLASMWFAGSVFGQSTSPTPRGLPPGLDRYIERVLDVFEVPGLALAVVQGDEVLLAKGYGVRVMGSTEPVNAQTLFPIASNSKAFTGAALAMLVDEGKIEWQDPVIEHLPWFRLADPYVTSELTIEDLLVHRSGIAPYAGDLLQFPPTTYSRRELVERLQYLPLTSSFRSTYAYDNVLYLVSGLLIE